MADYKTPGVYIEEQNAFPSSAVAVPTAVPVFIGYTEKASRKGKDLTRIPTRISSMAEYTELFGGPFPTLFQINDKASSPAFGEEEIVNLNGVDRYFRTKEKNDGYFYRSLRFFYRNGGSNCYILSVGSYEDIRSRGISMNDFIPADESKDVFMILEKEWEPTLLLMPDVVALTPATNDPGYYTLYSYALMHCMKTQSKVAIFDVARRGKGSDEDAILLFRTLIGTTGLNYGAAYYPWLKTSVVDASEIDHTLIDDWKTTLTKLIPATETNAWQVLNAITDASTKKDIHNGLMAASATYQQIMAQLRSMLNLLPPAAAMAGIYTLVDTSRGVWKAPANVSVSAANAPEVNISDDEQQTMNIDPISGKSINIIRAFPGIGTLVWGGRTLDGNSQDWRYINVRRTMIMIEQSLKLATRSYVFEPNDSATWITIKSMIDNFLSNLWKQGALAGATPDQAYSVQVGLGVTMTPNDILDGILRITVLLAIVRPAEFIEITFQQQQQKA